jgi:hypothetical protein
VAEARPNTAEAKVRVRRERNRRERGCRTRVRCWYHRSPRDRVQLVQAIAVDPRSGQSRPVGLVSFGFPPREPIIAWLQRVYDKPRREEAATIVQGPGSPGRRRHAAAARGPQRRLLL